MTGLFLLRSRLQGLHVLQPISDYTCYRRVTLYDKIPPYAYSTCLPFKHLFKNFYFIHILPPDHLVLRILLLLTENETPASVCPYVQCSIICNGKTTTRTTDEDKDDAWDSGWPLKKIIAEGYDTTKTSHTETILLSPLSCTEASSGRAPHVLNQWITSPVSGRFTEQVISKYFKAEPKDHHLD